MLLAMSQSDLPTPLFDAVSRNLEPIVEILCKVLCLALLGAVQNPMAFKYLSEHGNILVLVGFYVLSSLGAHRARSFTC